MDKLTRMESIIKHLASENGIDHSVLPTGSESGADPESTGLLKPTSPGQRKTTEVNGSRSGSISVLTASASGRTSPSSPSSLDGQFGRLVIDESKSYYVSNVLWANLANEVGEMRDMLIDPELDEDDEDYDMMFPKTPYSESMSSNAALFGFRAIAHSLRAYHPTRSQAVNLLDTFAENVCPQVRLFHMPTLSRMYHDAIASFESLDKNIEALLFAIYYATVASLDDQKTLSILGVTRAVAMETYRFAVEQAMARADLLNTQSMILLQTAVLFLSALRSQDESRTTWSLTALIYHIAQTMGIHRDGTLFGLKPFETEIRRRLWWHICILDHRSSEFNGFLPIAHQFSSDTKFPLHINDADLSPDMTEPPPERTESTDITLLLLRCEALRTAWKLGMASPGLSNVPAPWRTAAAAEEAVSGGFSLEWRKAIVRDLEGRVKKSYLSDVDTSKPMFKIYSSVADLIISQFWLLIYHLTPGSTYEHIDPNSTPSSDRGGRSSSTSSKAQSMASPNSTDGGISGDRDILFNRSIEVLEFSADLMNIPSVSKWLWYSKPHIQWHAVSFVLGEICSRPPSAQCDRAWKAAMAMNAGKGTLWRPVRRLMAKVKYVRELQAKMKGDVSDGQVIPENGIAPGTQPTMFTSPGDPSPGAGWSPCGYTPAGTSTLEVTDAVGFCQDGLGTEADDVMDLFNWPDDLHADESSTYGLSGGPRGFSLDMMGAGSAINGWDGRVW
ncbi:hypothetical protein VM1G_07434 [Cytospora mali]|uniref:Xylanolytic transcriptional activator regulatory domain-containing protein n=1 Tax=Cytospora mali TaxID=578113 RepID=A0A194W876_CYTMA|nr:hypothetical protein VM1G_07434 [Valsa mali]